MKPPHENYASLTAEELAADEFFQQWMLSPTLETNHFWQEFQQLYPEKKSLVENARKLLQLLQVEFSELPQEKVLLLKNRLEQTIGQPISAREIPAVPLRRSVFQRVSWVAAASITLLIGLLSYWYLIQNQPIEYATAFGQTRQVQLPDGSVVMLNSNSKLTFEADLKNKAIREVWLTGEAFFSIKHTPTHAKFQVHTNDLDVEVLGTEFNVSDRNQTTKVVLTSGKVQIKAANSSATLKPGDMAEFSRKTRQLTQHKVRTELYSSWKQNLWILDGETMTEVAQRIHDSFGVQVVFENQSLAKEKISGTIPTGSLEEVTEIMSDLLKTNIELVDETLIIK